MKAARYACYRLRSVMSSSTPPSSPRPETADPCHLKLKLLVLVVIVRDVDDACCLLDTLLQ